MAQLSVNFNCQWRFERPLSPEKLRFEHDDAPWRVLDLPHDWSIEERPTPDAPGYCRAAWLPNGTGVYRKCFRIPPEMADSHRIELEFDGVYKNSQVYVNGICAGGRPWGYIPFSCDITGLVNRDGENVVAVAVDNSAMPGTRWYSGTGIYRDVRLNFYAHAFFESGSVQVITHQNRHIQISYRIKNDTPERRKYITVFRITAPDGTEAACIRTPHVIGAGLAAGLEEWHELDSPELWSPENPDLYMLTCELFAEDGTTLLDTFKTRFGIREMECTADRGLFINGEPVKIHGVCLHNDGGSLGAACGKETFLRQLKILKTMGCNAVRTAHHPFSPYFLDACDELGVLVLAESFDEWQEPIRVMPYSAGEPQFLAVHYYAEIFDEWWKRDLTDMVKRDRNHPAIFAWSVGNEIPQMYKFSGYDIAGKLVECVHNLDSRPVTCAAVVGKISPRNLALFDIAGFNYPEGGMLDEFHAQLPDLPVLITEHFSAQTRRPLGCYLPAGELPREIAENVHPGAANFVRGFEQMKPGTAAWQATAERPYVMGEFIWTGFDYLGEPTPYDYPARSAFFGVIDTTGTPKDGYWYYRSVWKPEPLVHIASHWDYPCGTETDLLVISNCDTVELDLNGRPLGVFTGKDNVFAARIPFEPGRLTARGIQNGICAAKHEIYTSGAPARLVLIPEKDTVQPGEAAYFRCTLLDAANNPVRNSTGQVTFHVHGAGSLLALDSGMQISEEPYQNCSSVTLCCGSCLCIVRAARGQTGKIRVSAQLGALTSEAEISNR